MNKHSINNTIWALVIVFVLRASIAIEIAVVATEIVLLALFHLNKPKT